MLVKLAAIFFSMILVNNYVCKITKKEAFFTECILFIFY